MTNEEILREYTDDVCSGGHAQKAFILALSLARVDELRKTAKVLRVKPVTTRQFDCELLEGIASKIELECEGRRPC